MSGWIKRSAWSLAWKNKTAAFWMSVLTDMKARGVQDVLITATDNLNGFTNTIKAVFSQSTTQICVVPQIRNATRYVVWKGKKEFTKDMKEIYNAPTKEAVMKSTYLALSDSTKKWTLLIRNWGIILNQFLIIFHDRLKR